MKKLLLISLLIFSACVEPRSSDVVQDCKKSCHIEFIECLYVASNYGMTKEDCSLLRQDCFSECKNEVKQ